MANFNTHLVVAAASSGLASTVALKVGHVGASEALVLTFAGTIGGILPDVDLKYSYPSRIIFSFLGTLSALIAVFSTSAQYSILELWLLGFLTFYTIRYPVWWVFHKLTTHRGAIHSLTAGLLCCFLSSALMYHVLNGSTFFAWMFGGMVFFGFITHLVLDELYSVDFMNQRTKRSFGSALKMIDLDKKRNSLLIVVATFLVWQVTPDIGLFWTELWNLESWTNVQQSFLPPWAVDMIFK